MQFFCEESQLISKDIIKILTLPLCVQWNEKGILHDRQQYISPRGIVIMCFHS